MTITLHKSSKRAMTPWRGTARGHFGIATATRTTSRAPNCSDPSCYKDAVTAARKTNGRCFADPGPAPVIRIVFMSFLLRTNRWPVTENLHPHDVHTTLCKLR